MSSIIQDYPTDCNLRYTHQLGSRSQDQRQSWKNYQDIQGDQLNMAVFFMRSSQKKKNK